MTATAAPEPPAAPAPPEGFVPSGGSVPAVERAAATAPAAPAVPVRRRPRLTESEAWPGLVLGWFCSVFAAVALFAVSVPVTAAVYGVSVAAAFGIALLTAGSLPLAMRSAWAAVAAFLLGQLVFAVLGHPVEGAPWPMSVPLMIIVSAGIALLALRGRLAAAIALWGGAVAVSLIAAVLPERGATTGTIIASLVTSAAVSAGVLGLAWLARFVRRRVTTTIAHERRTSAAEHERRLIAEERTRIARELHDVVAHRMSIIQVQATSAPYRLTGLDEATTAEFGEIAAAARAAMAEMRELLQVLREPGAEAETAPQPGFAEIGALVSSVRRAGLEVDARIVTSARVSTAVGQVAYRIVQESLSNVLRHAPGQRASVEVQGDRERLEIEVVNRPADASGDAGPEASVSPAAAAAGHGVLGMRERARLVGGTIEVGPTPGGGFRVHAVLPVSTIRVGAAEPHAAQE